MKPQCQRNFDKPFFIPSAQKEMLFMLLEKKSADAPQKFQKTQLLSITNADANKNLAPWRLSVVEAAKNR